jgi:hypothetical protein
MFNRLNQVDLCFVVDTTGSMGNFIAAAKKQLLNAISSLSKNSNIDLQVGLVEYRDHPPQDKTFITRIYPLTDDLKKMQKDINKLNAQGGGDAPEAVYQGLWDTCQQMSWRNHSCRLILLVGDAPPHGFTQWWKTATGEQISGHGDTWKDGCPSGLDVYSVTAAAEAKGIQIYSLCMGGDKSTREAFGVLAAFTGATSTNVSNGVDVIRQIETLLQEEFSHLDFDRQVLETIQKLRNLEIQAIADALNSPRLPISIAMARLGKRGFLDRFVSV